MYTKHHTKGLILKSFDRGEADRAYALFTEKFGLVYAHAQGVRKEKSKLRGALQLLSYSDIVLVRARDRWRITDARVILNTWQALATTEKREVAARMCDLVRRLLGAEEAQPELFHTLAEGILFLSRTRLLQNEIESLEVLLALRILRHLGYLGESKALDHLLASPFINDILIFEAGRLRTRALSEINRSMKELPL